jgi:ubiquinone biosynthesis protein Coq4
MATQLSASPSCHTADLTLETAYRAFAGDPQHSIPFPVWLLENPDSPLSFPGQIYLREHDYLHILLDRGVSAEDEAFIVGFTMGNDPDTTHCHTSAFKFAAQFIYPSLYRFSKMHLMIFDCGFSFGRQSKTNNLNRIDYTQYLNYDIIDLREKLGIDVKSIQDLLGVSSNKPWLS